MKRIKYCFLVYCNCDPIVYGVYSNKKSAMKYVNFLIDYRCNRAKYNNWEFGHYFLEMESKRKENDYEKYQEKVVFYTSLKIKDNNKEYTEDRTIIKIIRKPISSEFED